MKRSSAFRYSEEIARRVHAVNGLLATPLCGPEAVRISRVWVFGSAAKGSQSPNDLDVLIELRPCGRRRRWENGAIDRDLRRRMGIKVAQCSPPYTLKWLTKGMKMVSRHTTFSETAELDVKKLIYPRYEMDQE